MSFARTIAAQFRRPSGWRLVLLNLLNEVSSIDIPVTDVSGRRPWFYLSVLRDDADSERFLRALDWFVEEVRAWEGPQASR